MVHHVQRVFAVIGCIFLLSLATQGMATEYDHTIQSPNKKMTFSWKIEGDQLAIKVSAETKGWIGVGFNPSHMMKDANIIIGYVKNGKTVITDQFGKSTISHEEDEKAGGASNVTVIGGKEEGHKTTLEFAIPLNSGDSHDKPIDVHGETELMLAYGAQDVIVIKHQYRTEMKVNLTTGKVQ